MPGHSGSSLRAFSSTPTLCRWRTTLMWPFLDAQLSKYASKLDRPTWCDARAKIYYLVRTSAL